MRKLLNMQTFVEHPAIWIKTVCNDFICSFAR